MIIGLEPAVTFESPAETRTGTHPVYWQHSDLQMVHVRSSVAGRIAHTHDCATEKCPMCRAMECKVAELRASTDLTHIWIHADLDAFFASVEELDDPSLVRHL